MGRSLILGWKFALIAILAAALFESASAATPACGTNITAGNQYILFDRDLNCTTGLGDPDAYALAVYNASNVTIDCAGYMVNANWSRRYGVLIGGGASNITIKECRIMHPLHGTTSEGIHIASVSPDISRNLTVVNTTIDVDPGVSSYGITSKPAGAETITMRNLTISAGIGVWLRAISNITLIDSTIIGSSMGIGAEIYSESGEPLIRNALISGCEIYGFDQEGIKASRWEDSAIRGNYVHDIAYRGISIGPGMSRVEVTGNDVSAGGSCIITSFGTQYDPDYIVTLASNSIHGCGNHGVSIGNGINDSLFYRNNITGCGGYGVYATSIWVTNLTLLENNITGNNLSGIYFESQSHPTLTSNYVCGNGLAGGYDIEDVSGASGDDNTCETARGYADAGRTGGCDTSCSGCADGDMDGFYPTPGCAEPLDCDDLDPEKVPAYENQIIKHDTVLCPGTYHLNGSDYNGALEIAADNVTLDCDGASLVGNYPLDPFISPTCIEINGHNVTVKNCVISDYATGIAGGGSDNKAEGNTISNTSSGIDMVGENCRITGNTVSSSLEGIWAAHLDNCEISGNTLEENVIGIRLLDSTTTAIFGNTITSAITEFTQQLLEGSEDSGLTYGILIETERGNVTDNNVTNNTISGSDYCIALNETDEGYEFDSNSVSGNNITSCAIGLFMNIASGNTFDQNYICGSTDTDIYVQSKDVTDVGDNNTCQTVFGWVDTTSGPTGCTNWCGPLPAPPAPVEEAEEEENHGGSNYYMFGTGTPQPPKPPIQPPAQPPSSGTPTGGATAGGGLPNATAGEQPGQPGEQGTAAGGAEAGLQQGSLTPTTRGLDLSWPLWLALIAILGIVLYLLLVKTRKAAKKKPKRGMRRRP